MARWRRLVLAGSMAAICWLAGAPPPARADITYVYDVLGRLVGVVDHSGEAAAYRYDEVGNLLGVERFPAGATTILGFSPAAGPSGTAVIIEGVGFGATPADNQVAIGGVAAPVAAASARRLVVTVPAGAVTAPITVAGPAGSASSDTPFVVAESQAPRISGFTPAMGPPGTPVTISGERFEVGATTVTFNGRYAALGAVTPATITATVPDGASSGRIGVSTSRGQVTSGQDFVVLPASLTAASVEQLVRVDNPGSARVAVTTPGKVAVAVFDAALGERVAVRLEQITGGQSAITVYGPDGAALASATTFGPAGGPLRVVVPRAGTCVVVVDPDNLNTAAMTLALGIADLELAAVTAPATITTGQQVTVSWTGRNVGTGPTLSNWFDRVYLSPRSGCCGAAPALKLTAPTEALSPGVPPNGSYTLSGMLTVPPLSPGAYDLTVIADLENWAWDRDQANNRRTVEVAVTAPDLAMRVLTAPAAAVTQDTVQVSWTVRNRGVGPTPASGWTDAVYLSPTPGCCDGAVRLATVRRTAVTAAGTNYKASATVTVPTIAAGDWHVVVVADANGEVHEMAEGNNDRAAPIRITTPDLTPTALRAPATISAPGSASVSWTVANAGTGPVARAWNDRIYLTSSPTCCAGAAVLLTVPSAPGLAAGATYTKTRSVPIPDVPAGPYYLFVRTDHANSVWEANEQNNRKRAPVTLMRGAP